MTIRGVLFDKDGTLIDVHGMWVPIYRKLLAEQLGVTGAEATALMEPLGYDPQTDSLRVNSIMASGTTRQLIEAWWPQLDDAAIVEKIRLFENSYMPHGQQFLKALLPLQPLLQELRGAGYKVGVATNDTIAAARLHMATLGVEQAFDAIIAADTVAVPKPSGQMIQRFAQITGLAPHEIAMVGDNAHDMEEARNGGAGLAIAVLTGTATVADITFMADFTLADIGEIPALLARL